jgi:hypothetical protein
MIVQDATESGDAKYRCAECNLQFGTPRDLSRHLNKTARHGGQPSPCAICHKPLTRPDSRARHERRCRERFGVTEEMWQGIERERQRGRRKSISVDGPEEPNTQLAGDGGCDATTATASTGREHCGGGGGGGITSGSSRSRTVSVSEVSDAELVAALASTKVASSAPGPNSMPGSRYMPNQPSGESSASWTRRRSASLRAPHPQPTPLPSAKDGAVPMNGRKRRESSPHARGVLPPPPPPQSRVAPTTSPHWRTVSRLPHQHPHHLHHHHEVRDDSPPFEPPSSPMAIQDESDGEPMVSTSAYRSPQHQHQHQHLQQHQQPRWTPLVKREERLVEFAQEGEEDEEDELEDEDEPWHPPSVSRVHNNQQGMMTSLPPPKKKLFGFEQDGTGTGGGIAGWSPSHKTQR